MRSSSILIRLGTVAIVLFQVGCVSQQKLTRTHVPEDISLEELRKEMRSTHQNLYGFGGAVLMGAAGFVSGAYIGYKAAPMIDCRRGCDDHSLEVAVLGSMIGLTSGLFLGGHYGSQAGAMKDLNQAIERIRRRRDAELKNEPNSIDQSTSPRRQRWRARRQAVS